MYFTRNINVCETFDFIKWLLNCVYPSILLRGSAVAWWLMPRTPDPEVGGSSPTRVKPCCVLEQGTYTPQKVLVIPRKRWLCPNMNGKLFTGTLRINQSTNNFDSSYKMFKEYYELHHIEKKTIWSIHKTISPFSVDLCPD